MYKGKFASELLINEVKEYYDELRQKYPLTDEQWADFNILKEKLISFACKTLKQEPVLDKIRAEIESKEMIETTSEREFYNMALKDVLQIIGKHKAESEELNERIQ